MTPYAVSLLDAAALRPAVVGGKAAHLAALARMADIHVPLGFCVTTNAFRRTLARAGAAAQLQELARTAPGDTEAVATLSAAIRRTVAQAPIPEEVEAAVIDLLAEFGEEGAYAVRSSATAEDLPTASFAGQHETSLNVVGRAAILRHVSRCWASLFSDRAVSYRQRNGVDHATVAMAVIVQRMVAPQAAGVLFTADPMTGNRKVARISAGFGLGEAMVSGEVDADEIIVRDGEVLDRRIGTQQRATVAEPGGGTRLAPIEPERRQQPALTDEQAVRLVAVGRQVEAQFGTPQDIEWCLADDDFAIVQSRPITTLFPIPDTGDDQPHVFVSVGHQQMMTDAMKPLGWSIFQLTAARPMYEAAGRLFVDVSRELASPTIRPGLLGLMGRSDPLIADALQTVVDRGDLLPEPPPTPPVPPPGASTGSAGDESGSASGPAGSADEPTGASLVDLLIRRTDASVAAMEREIATKSGSQLIAFIRADLAELKGLLFEPQSHSAVMAGMQAMWWLTDHLQEWLGDPSAADLLTQSAPGNVTSEMGLALLDVADAIRPYPDVVAFLREGKDGDFLAALDDLAGGPEARAAIEGWLDRYGMRCVGEIDVTRPRWREQPAALLPVLLGHVDQFEPGEGRRRFEQGRQGALQYAQELLERLRTLPHGEQKALETKRMIDQLRTFIGYREYPKYGIIRRYFAYKQALLAEAERLAAAGLIEEPHDIFWLPFAELAEVVGAHQQPDRRAIERRKDAFRASEALHPPRVLTSDGEAIAGSYRRDDVPAGALMGLPVSAGTVEGRARVIADLEQADVAPGDILVTTHTDPSWTPLFVTVAALVTEVGGLMTHGAVIAREYGLPAVVGVVDATRSIPDGHRIRVSGTEGYVELLP